MQEQRSKDSGEGIESGSKADPAFDRYYYSNNNNNNYEADQMRQWIPTIHNPIFTSRLQTSHSATASDASLFSDNVVSIKKNPEQELIRFFLIFFLIMSGDIKLKRSGITKEKREEERRWEAMCFVGFKGDGGASREIRREQRFFVRLQIKIPACFTSLVVRNDVAFY